MKEDDSMVRKAETLGTLRELRISNRTYSYVSRHFNSLDEIVKEGRVIAYTQELGALPEDKAPKWRLELAAALREAGFVRDATDFAMTFGTGSLYAAVYGEGFFVTGIKELSNEQYEDFQGLTETEISEVEVALSSLLTGIELGVIECRFGLDGRDKRGTMIISRELGVTVEKVRQAESRALRKLRLLYPEALPVVFKAPDDVDKKMEGLINQLCEIRRDPVLIKERKLVYELDKMVHVPLKYYMRRGDIRGLLHYY